MPKLVKERSFWLYQNVVRTTLGAFLGVMLHAACTLTCCHHSV